MELLKLSKIVEVKELQARRSLLLNFSNDIIGLRKSFSSFKICHVLGGNYFFQQNTSYFYKAKINTQVYTELILLQSLAWKSKIFLNQYFLLRKKFLRLSMPLTAKTTSKTTIKNFIKTGFHLIQLDRW